jgi:hypothetical protein
LGDRPVGAGCHAVHAVGDKREEEFGITEVAELAECVDGL